MSNYSNIVQFDDANSNGYAVTIFMTGCSHGCEGCQNPSTWDCNTGKPFDENVQQQIIEHIKENESFYEAFVFSGGDPLHNANLSTTINFAKELKSLFTNIKIWIYTGYDFKNIPRCNEILECTDYIKCGKYDKSESCHSDNIQYDIRLATSNQKIYKKGVDY